MAGGRLRHDEPVVAEPIRASLRVSIRRFLCGAILHAGEIVPEVRGKSLHIVIRKKTVSFNIRHLKRGRDGDAVLVDRPVEGGVTVLELTQAKEAGRSIDIGRPGFFVVNLYAQWTPELAACLQGKAEE